MAKQTQWLRVTLLCRKRVCDQERLKRRQRFGQRTCGGSFAIYEGCRDRGETWAPPTTSRTRCLRHDTKGRQQPNLCFKATRRPNFSRMFLEFRRQDREANGMLMTSKLSNQLARVAKIEGTDNSINANNSNFRVTVFVPVVGKCLSRPGLQ